MAEWSRAREALPAAETLTREHCHADAISRAYHAILHAAKAALHIHDGGCEPCRSKADVWSAFGSLWGDRSSGRAYSIEIDVASDKRPGVSRTNGGIHSDLLESPPTAPAKWDEPSSET